jgi:hypothetical protein
MPNAQVKYELWLHRVDPDTGDYYHQHDEDGMVEMVQTALTNDCLLPISMKNLMPTMEVCPFGGMM